MPSERYYKPILFSINDAITFEDTEYHHLVRVMRNAPGDSVEIVNGKGQLAHAVVTSIEKRAVHLTIRDIVQENPPQAEIIIAQAIPRHNRLDFILEKGTELGMTQLWLFPGELSEKKSFTSQQLERIENVMIAAMKQCGRLFLPKVVLLPPISEWKPFEFASYFGDLSPDAPSFISFCLKGKNRDVIFCIGPESGFTKKEITLLKKLGSVGVKLHHNVLRTDTASLVALSLISQESMII